MKYFETNQENYLIDENDVVYYKEKVVEPVNGLYNGLEVKKVDKKRKKAKKPTRRK